ncbi:MAG: ABC transporter substrate-binding protein [Planctomycetes bacterium]|nr:ABC transporter substrate-binding protein [Planctomycetota bacterium]
MRTKALETLSLCLAGILLAGSGCKKTPTPAPQKKAEAPSGKAAPAPPVKSTAQGEPIKVGAIFAVTGGAANLGGPEAKTAEMFVEKLNGAGGINGRPIQLVIKDSATTPTQAVSLAKQLIEEDKVLAIIGPSTSGETMAIKNICQEGKTILLSCAAAETIVNPVASYVFKTPQKDSDAARRILQTMKDAGITKVGVVTSNDGFGIAGGDQLKALKDEYGITIAAIEAYDAKETDLTGVLTKVKGAEVQAVINWSVVPAQALIAKNMKQIGFNVPLFQSHGFGNIRYVQAGGEATNGTIFPCGRLLVADALPADNPQKKLLVDYKSSYETRYKEDASTFGGHAYDALLLLTEAIKKAGSTDTDKVRDALENLKGVVGTGGIFNLSAADHNGLDQNAFEILTVVDGKFAVYQKK